jgi:4-hydroxyproline epimerase
MNRTSSDAAPIDGLRRIHVIDSHTAGEPTRVVIGGGPDLGGGSVAERLTILRERFDGFRSAVVNEPRGSDVLVGALLCEPGDPSCAAGAIFFNNVGYLGMCGHGAIGLVATLAHLGRIGPGTLKIETPVGIVEATLAEDGAVAIRNVPSHRAAKDIRVEVAGIGAVVGDVAWGGNWFFLVRHFPDELALGSAARLTAAALRIREAINARGFPQVDHVELFGPARGDGAHARNFVLCPGGAYDRSPCGTGTSAKLACLAADGKLAEGEPWVQESIIGSTFRGRYRWLDRDHGIIEPTIEGVAWITMQGELLLHDGDPFREGIR